MIGKLEKMDTFRQLIEDGDSDEYAQNEAVQILILESRSLDVNIEILADDEKEFEKDKATEKVEYDANGDKSDADVDESGVLLLGEEFFASFNVVFHIDLHGKFNCFHISTLKCKKQ